MFIILVVCRISKNKKYLLNKDLTKTIILTISKTVYFICIVNLIVEYKSCNQILEPFRTIYNFTVLNWKNFGKLNLSLHSERGWWRGIIDWRHSPTVDSIKNLLEDLVFAVPRLN